MCDLQVIAQAAQSKLLWRRLTCDSPSRVNSSWLPYLSNHLYLISHFLIHSQLHLFASVILVSSLYSKWSCLQIGRPVVIVQSESNRWWRYLLLKRWSRTCGEQQERSISAQVSHNVYIRRSAFWCHGVTSEREALTQTEKCFGTVWELNDGRVA